MSATVTQHCLLVNTPYGAILFQNYTRVHDKQTLRHKMKTAIGGEKNGITNTAIKGGGLPHSLCRMSKRP